jgi:hypothetical protein
MSEHTRDITKISVALRNLKWVPMDASQDWFDGAILLAAVPVCKYKRAADTSHEWEYEYSIVRIACDENYFSVQLHDGNDWGWELSDVDWYVIVRE